MCWTSRNPFAYIPKKAKENIKVFKVCGINNKKEVKPLFFPTSDVTYREGELYEAEMEYLTFFNERSLDLLSIHKGLHSYSSKLVEISHIDYSKTGVDEELGLELDSIKEVHLKFSVDPYPYRNHGYMIEGVEEDSGFTKYGLALVSCHIPKGSKYVINSKGEIVSEKLVVDKISKNEVIR